jgi:hypothetical protein
MHTHTSLCHTAARVTPHSHLGDLGLNGQRLLLLAGAVLELGQRSLLGLERRQGGAIRSQHHGPRGDQLLRGRG